MARSNAALAAPAASVAGVSSKVAQDGGSAEVPRSWLITSSPRAAKVAMCCCTRSEACIAVLIAVTGNCGRVSGSRRASATAVAARPSAARIGVGMFGIP